MIEPASNSLEQIQELFHRIDDLPVEERAAALADLAREDASVAAVVRDLLDAAERPETALDRPAIRAFPPEPPEEIPGYHIRGRLGRGGSASVYLAEQEREGFTREVALKIVDRSPESQLFERVLEEQRILASLEHPGIARLYDAGFTPSGRPYLAMERVEGEDILSFARRTQASVRQRLELFLTVLSAVEYAHGRAVVHRDLKPGNILVSARGESKLLDFGIARLVVEPSAAESPPTETAHTLRRAMTPAYASPEQIDGRRIGVPSDIYSLGVVLYELLTGVRPYRLDDPRYETLERAIREQDPERPSNALRSALAAVGGSLPRRRRELRGDLDAIVLKALRKESAARYPMIAAFSADIRAWLAGLPVGARRGSRLYSAGKFVRRRRAALWNVALFAGLAVSTFLWMRGRSTESDPNLSPWRIERVPAAARSAFESGLVALSRREITPGVAQLRSAVERAPRHPVVRAALADGLLYAERSEEANLEAATALALARSDSGMASTSRRWVESMALRAAGQSQEAAKLLRSMWLLAPRNFEIGLFFGRSVLAAGEPAEALRVAEQLRVLLAEGPSSQVPDPACEFRVDILEFRALDRMGRAQEVLDRSAGKFDTALRCGQRAHAGQFLMSGGFALDALGKTAETRAAARRALEIFRAVGEDGEIAEALHLTCLTSIRAAQHDAAEAECGESLRMQRQLGHLNGIARVLNILGASRRRRGLFEPARSNFSEALAISRRINDRVGESRYLHNLANIDLGLGRLPEAETTFRDSVAIKRATQDERGLPIALQSLAQVLLARASLGDAETLLVEAEAIDRKLGNQRELALVLTTRAALAEIRDQQPEAERFLDEAIAIHQRGGERDSVAYHGAQKLALASASQRAAARSCETIATAARELGSLKDRRSGQVAIWAAQCFAEAGGIASAESWMAVAVKTVAAAAGPAHGLELRLAQGRIAMRAGRYAEAARLVEEVDRGLAPLDYGGLRLESRLLEAQLAAARGDHPERVAALRESVRREAQARGFVRIAREVAN